MKKIIDKIFSVKNNDMHKIVTIVGIKIKFRRKNDVISEQLRQHTVAINKRLDDIFYNQQVLSQVPFVHKNLLQFKNCNKNKDAVLIATGPTLNFYDKNIEGIHCGVNAAVRIADYLDYLFSIDDPVMDIELREEIINYKPDSCIKFFGILPSRRLKKINKDTNMHFTERILPQSITNANAYTFLIEDIEVNKWAVDIEREPFGDFYGAVFCALQFLLYTHPKRIFLTGCDCTRRHAYKDNEITARFDNEFKIKSFYFLFKKFKDNVYPDIEIISVNPVGLKGMFRDIYTENYLNEHEEIRNELNIEII